jgi:hypothetical protein
MFAQILQVSTNQGRNNQELRVVNQELRVVNQELRAVQRQLAVRALADHYK